MRKFLLIITLFLIVNVFTINHIEAGENLNKNVYQDIKDNKGISTLGSISDAGDKQKPESENDSSWTIGDIKDLFNIAFFIVIGGVTVLTFLKANKTLLQPIRTEIFKEQLKLFSEIMEIFNGKSEIELREFFEFPKLIKANIFLLLDNYCAVFYENLKFDREKRPYNLENCPGGIILESHLNKYVKPIDFHFKDSGEKEDSFPKKSNEDIWKEYKHAFIPIPKDYELAQKKIEKIMKSPLLPHQCIKLLKEILKRNKDNIGILQKVLDEVAQELPKVYTDEEKMEKASLDWIHNRYNAEFLHLEENAIAITSYLRDYFKVDVILN